MGMGFFEYLDMGLGMGVGFFEYLGVGLDWGVGNPTQTLYFIIFFSRFFPAFWQKWPRDHEGLCPKFTNRYTPVYKLRLNKSVLCKLVTIII